MRKGEIDLGSAHPYREVKIELGKKIDPEILEDLEEARYDLSVSNLRKDDNDISACFNYCKKGEKGDDSDYRHIDKSFKSWKQFSDYAEKFFQIAEMD